MSNLLLCKKCKSDNLVKNGSQNNKQRYKCKDCGRVFRDSSPKYSAEFKFEAIKMYLSSMSIRAIARIKKVHHSVVSSWIKKIGSVTKELYFVELSRVQPKNIQILEIDELFTYIKKKKIKHIYLVLSTETQTELLISK